MTLLQILLIVVVVIGIALLVSFSLGSRLTIVAALFLFLASALAIATGRELLANQFSIYALYFLCAGVILLLIQNLGVVRWAWSKKWITSWGSHLNSLKTSISSMVLSEIVNTKKAFAVAKVDTRKLVTTAKFGKKAQMMKAIDIQDEMGKQSIGWRGTRRSQEMARGETKVIDASVAIQWFSEGANSDEALEIRQGIVDRKIKVVIPDLALFEMVDALKHNPNIAESDVVAALQSIQKLGVKIVLANDLTEAATKLAFRYDIALNRAFYIALANKIGADFITADKELYDSLKQLESVKLLGHEDEYKGIED